MDIRQLSVSYQLDQDRILVRVNTSVNEEVLMWLTRHMMLRLWPMINRVVIDHLAIPADAKTDGYVDLNAIGPGTRKMLADMRRQEAVEKADFSTPYQGEVAARPLGETPLLVTEVNLTPKTNGQLQMNFKELLREPASNRGFQLDMPADLVFGERTKIYTTKLLTGHGLGAGGVLETAVAALTYETGQIPAPRLVAEAHPRVLNGVTQRQPGATLKSSIGMGGYNAALVIDRLTD